MEWFRDKGFDVRFWLEAVSIGLIFVAFAAMVVMTGFVVAEYAVERLCGHRSRPFVRRLIWAVYALFSVSSVAAIMWVMVSVIKLYR